MLVAFLAVASAQMEVVEVPPVGVALHDGDMLLTEKQKMVYGDAAFAGAGVHKQDIWPKGVIA